MSPWYNVDKRGDHVTDTEKNRILLALRRHPRETESEYDYRFKELIGLCEAAGGDVVGSVVQVRSDIDGAFYLGSGKVNELRVLTDNLDANLVIFDSELSPAQIRNLEAKLEQRVIDRTQLILDIFALRARSKEGRLQVEVAQLQYMLPRLTGRGIEMSRLGGGIGTRGPGETKLEMDRRRIRDRIAYIRHQLGALTRTRRVQREKRARSVPVVALVGYTNAGKTTLLGRWTRERGTNVLDGGNARLFDTLDPTARRVKAGATGDIVLLDTVGFVQDLPHLLVNAFRATLEEALAADVIVHVVDGSVDSRTHIETTYKVLKEIGVLDKPIVTFFNKMDISTLHPGPDTHATVSIYGSAGEGTNIESLYETVDRLIGFDPIEIIVEGSPSSGIFWQNVITSGKVVETSHISEDVVQLKVMVERRVAPRLQERMKKLEKVRVEFAKDE